MLMYFFSLTWWRINTFKREQEELCFLDARNFSSPSSIKNISRKRRRGRRERGGGKGGGGTFQVFFSKVPQESLRWFGGYRCLRLRLYPWANMVKEENWFPHHVALWLSHTTHRVNVCPSPIGSKIKCNK